MKQDNSLKKKKVERIRPLGFDYKIIPSLSEQGFDLTF